MKILFCSNYLNHHQIPFCQKMFDLCNGEFYFAAMEPMAEERQKMGWGLQKRYPFEIQAWESKENREETKRLISESDVVIYGGGTYAPLMHDRIKDNKLTFFISERVYRKGIYRCISPRGQYYMRRDNTQYKKNNLYLLSSGAYTPFDYSLVGAYRNKAFKWGYFPKTNKYELSELMDKKKPGSILWVSRFIKLKHPEKVIEVARRLKEEGYNFSVDMIGIGELTDDVNAKIRELGLEQFIRIHGSMSPDEVRKYMEESRIFLMTSDYQEGWGAVINESMNSGCAVVASHAIGAVPYLIENGKNGFIYKDSNINDLYLKTKALLDAPQMTETIGRKAYETIITLWNAESAAERLYDLIGKINSGNTRYEDNGPCSIARNIRQSKMYEEVLKGQL